MSSMPRLHNIKVRIRVPRVAKKLRNAGVCGKTNEPFVRPRSLSLTTADRRVGLTYVEVI